MLEQLANLRRDLLPEERPRLPKWRERVHSRSEIMRVLLLHEMIELFFKLVNDQDPLRFVSILDKCLQDSAAIMLEAEFRVLIAYRFDALVDEYMLLGISHLFLPNQQLVVVDPQFLDQIRYLLLSASIQDGCHAWFWRVLFAGFVFVLTIDGSWRFPFTKKTIVCFRILLA